MGFLGLLLRIPPELHEKLAIEVQAHGKSINGLAQEALQERGASGDRWLCSSWILTNWKSFRPTSQAS